MCTYVFGVLPPETDAEALRTIFERHEIGLRNAQHEEFSGVAGQIFYTTRSFCDCGTVIGSARYEPYGKSLEQQLKDELEKVRRKGWSAAKIARWQADKQQNLERHHLPADLELKRWLEFVPALLDESEVAWFGMFYHWDWQERHITVEREQRLNVEALDAELLKNMQADILYRFAA